jgi:hypothetical protein
VKAKCLSTGCEEPYVLALPFVFPSYLRESTNQSAGPVARWVRECALHKPSDVRWIGEVQLRLTDSWVEVESLLQRKKNKKEGKAAHERREDHSDSHRNPSSLLHLPTRNSR